MKKLLSILSVLTTVSATAQLCFGPTANYTASLNPYSICSADFNGDGKPDLAVANKNSNAFSVMLNNGTGGFGSVITHTTGATPQSVCTADFNNDAIMDLALTPTNMNKVQVFLGNGNGTFGAATNLTTGTYPWSVCASDFNGDGKMDLASCNWSANNISVFIGNGNGTFAPTVNYTGGGGMKQIIAVDFNNDNKPDLATANDALPGTVFVLMNSGTGTFGTVATYTAGDNTQFLCGGDFDGDGKNDIVASNNGSNNISFLKGDGAGSLSAPANFTVGVSPMGVTAADFNGDSKLDVAVCSRSSAQALYVMLGNGAGSFSSVPFGYDGGTDPISVVSGDFDLNGKIDVAFANENSHDASVILNSAPLAGISGTLAICSTSGGTTLSSNSALTYSWSTGGTGQSESVHPVAGTTSYTLSATNTQCTTTTVATVSVTPTPTLSIFGNTFICSGSSTTLTGGTATTYTWSANAGNSHLSSVIVSPTSTDVYYLSGENNGCVATTSVTVNVTSTPTVIISGSLAICTGQGTTLLGSSASNYTWSTGDHTSNTTVSPMTNTSYTLTEANGVCTGSAVATVSVTTTPTVSVSGISNLCFGNSAVLSACCATTYTWSSNAGNAVTNTVSVNPTSGTTYTVTGGNPLADASGECVASDTKSINVVTVPTPSICMVTVDDSSKNNVIYWDKTGFTNMHEFFIYRDTANNNYALIGKVSKDSLSLFVDTARHIGSVNGDPNVGTYRYKIALKDTCGNLSPMSPYHNTVYTINQGGGTFTYNQYSIEGQSTPVPGLSQYILKRDNLNTNSYVTAATIGASSTVINDPAYATYQLTANWYVETNWTTVCTPTFRMGGNGTQATIVKSKSNITNNRTTGTKNNVLNSFSMYPNPTNGNLT
ncbi:MAG: FG-GAP-like repeat-containing protein, partial [Bacteroidia bacterium]